jgi:PAS domain S-box-containing protein
MIETTKSFDSRSAVKSQYPLMDVPMDATYGINSMVNETDLEFKSKTREELLLEIISLRSRLQESDETLRAIRHNMVDAFVVDRSDGTQVFTLKSADRGYGALLEALGEGTAILAPQDVIFSCNSRLGEIVGIPVDSILGNPFSNLVEHGERERFRELLERGESKTIHCEIHLHSMDGRRIPVQLTVSSLDVEERPGVFVVVRNLSEQKGAEAALRESGELFRSTIESTDQGILVVNERREVLAANACFRKMWRIPEEQLITGDDRNLYTHVLNQLEEIEGFLSKNIDLWASPEKRRDLLHFKDGRIFERTAHPLMLQGRVAGRVLRFVDVTEQQSAQKDLQRSQFKFSSVFDNALDAIVILDDNGELIEVNPAACAIFGATREQIIGRRGIEFTEPRCNFIQNWQDFLAHGEKKGDVVIRRPDGTSREMEYTATSNFLPGQHLAIMRDVTDRKEMERHLLRSEKDLRRLSSQLLVAQEDERRRIAAELHDSIASSLSAVKFALERLGEETEQQKESTPVADTLKMLVSMLQQAIDETRRVMNNLRPPLLDDLGLIATIRWFCRQCQTIYSDVAIEQNVDLQEPEIPEPLRIVIFRIIQEAFHNLIKHSRADLLEINLLKRDGFIELIIRDNGVGFDVQATLATGKGLGLTSMRERSEFFGGTFAIESEPGEGTTLRASWQVDASHGFSTQTSAAALQEKAESLLAARSHRPENMSPEDIERLVYESDVSNIELQLQMEELRKAHARLRALRDKYLEWYDSAPVGYLTLSDLGIILEANLTAAQLLGCSSKSDLIHRMLSSFVAAEDRELLHFHLRKIFQSNEQQTCKLQLKAEENGYVVKLVSKLERDANGNAKCITWMADISERQRVEQSLYRLEAEKKQRINELTRELASLQMGIAEHRQREQSLLQSEAALHHLAAGLLRAQEEERTVVSEELHNGTGQVLAAIKFGVEHALSAVERGNTEAAKSMQDLIPRIRNALEEVRSLYMKLRPTILDDFGIDAAVGWLCRGFQKSHPNISVDVEIDEMQIAEPVKSVAFRTVQDALENISQYSRASSVRLWLRHTRQGLELTIRDNGIRYEVATELSPDNPEAMSLAIMKERVESTGGLFSVDSAPGQGNSIYVSWPFKKQPIRQ